MNLTLGMSAYSCCNAALSGPSPTSAKRVSAGSSFRMIFNAFKFFSADKQQEWVNTHAAHMSFASHNGNSN